MSAETEIKNCQRKVRYTSKEVAERAGIKQMKMSFAGPSLEAYECEWCRGWHLTKLKDPLDELPGK